LLPAFPFLSFPLLFFLCGHRCRCNTWVVEQESSVRQLKMAIGNPSAEG
jgi:hypothetical protein